MSTKKSNPEKYDLQDIITLIVTIVYIFVVVLIACDNMARRQTEKKLKIQPHERDSNTLSKSIFKK